MGGVSRGFASPTNCEHRPLSQPANPAEPASAVPSFEQSLSDLERIVQDLEDGELGLTESLARYELGVKRLRACYELLERAERRIELLTGVDPQGNPQTQAFDGTSTLEKATNQGGEKAPRRKKARPAVVPPKTAEIDDVDSAEGLF